MGDNVWSRLTVGSSICCVFLQLIEFRTQRGAGAWTAENLSSEFEESQILIILVSIQSVLNTMSMDRKIVQVAAISSI